MHTYLRKTTRGIDIPRMRPRLTEELSWPSPFTVKSDLRTLRPGTLLSRMLVVRELEMTGKLVVGPPDIVEVNKREPSRRERAVKKSGLVSPAACSNPLTIPLKLRVARARLVLFAYKVS